MKSYSTSASKDLFSIVKNDPVDNIIAALNNASPSQLQHLNEDGDSLMHVAVKRGNAEIISILFSRGISIYLKNSKSGLRASDLPQTEDVHNQIRRIHLANVEKIKYFINDHNDTTLLTYISQSQMPCAPVLNYILELVIRNRQIEVEKFGADDFSRISASEECQVDNSDLIQAWYQREFVFQLKTGFKDLSVIESISKIGLKSFYLVGKSGNLISPYLLIDQKFAIFDKNDLFHTGTLSFSKERDDVVTLFSKIANISNEIAFYSSDLKNSVSYNPEVQLKGRNIPEPYFTDIRTLNSTDSEPTIITSLKKEGFEL
ncbi:ankyrin repeat domain-containing protein [Bdellovibrio sp. NC01]|uniref:ankyrin repeat domain-containing protein n=1 Tax=Bdellovibrio sp. NC01 TaxID=2220073 RepID=UPI00115BC56C|nr:ankyrin repeat domain-containing protein [Bdellovibrio sp. NC01]